VKKDLTPLCKLDAFCGRPNAWVKLWKHHAADKQADRLNQIARERQEPFLQWYGGKISSEWFVPKVMQTLEEDPEVYRAADYFMEASEWIVAVLSGRLHRNNCAAGYKCMWSREEGYPSNEFFEALHPELAHFVEQKLPAEIKTIGERVGSLTIEAAKLTGLPAGIAVAAGILDAHASMPAMGITKPKEMMMAMGTSLCHILNGTTRSAVEGICGCVYSGAMPGSYQYETGQPASGDILNWFVDHCVPPAYFEQAEAEGINIYAYLDKLAEKVAPGSNGLVALDWWNGNRSTLVDINLSGLMIGMTLATRTEEMYRALVEASAFGTRYILEACQRGGVEVETIYASGGLSYKSPFWVQLFTDVLDRPIHVSAEKHTAAIGAAILAAVAAGSGDGGYDNFDDACSNMKTSVSKTYVPNGVHKEKYDRVYAFYRELYSLFGQENQIMRRLKELAAEQGELVRG